VSGNDDDAQGDEDADEGWLGAAAAGVAANNTTVWGQRFLVKGDDLERRVYEVAR